MPNRKQKKVDVLVIGGGINGAGIARDLAGRGLSVMLVEKDDLASATSSASTKLIHGGLRYLEHFRFGLVRAALKEREVLMRAAPHIISPMTFILPHRRGHRPRWMIRLGLFLYDHLYKRKLLPPSRRVSLAGKLPGQPLRREIRHGFSYADCWVEDTRLVVLNALDAAERGAEVLTRVECVNLSRHLDKSGWIATLQDNITGERGKVEAAMVVNASGPWVEKTLQLADKDLGRHRLRWVKGSHIIVPRLYKGDHAYILQNDDGRVVFVIPYEHRFSLIGTTDVEYKGDIEEVRTDFEEVEYLCAAVSRYFRQAVTPDDVEWTYSGVRPLVDDGEGSASAVTRDYILDVDDYGGAPMLSVYGGKLTTYRKLAEQAGNKVVLALGRGSGAWTGKAVLPGAEGIANFTTFYKTYRREFNWLPEPLARRLAHAYGTRTRDMMRGFKRLSDMGEHLGDGVYEAEIRYLVNVEWAMTLEDVIWRRSKVGLHISPATEKKIRKLLKKLLGSVGG